MRSLGSKHMIELIVIVELSPSDCAFDQILYVFLINVFVQCTTSRFLPDKCRLLFVHRKV